MKKEVSLYDFRNAFMRSEERKSTFSYDALGALYDYLIDYEVSCETEIEFGMVALCCEYTEYESAVNCLEDIGSNFEYSDHGLSKDEDILTDDEKENEALEYLQNQTQVIEFDGGVIIQEF